MRGRVRIAALRLVLPVALAEAQERPMLLPARPSWCSPRRWRRVWRRARELARFLTAHQAEAAQSALEAS